jgi:hypothetical protein
MEATWRFVGYDLARAAKALGSGWVTLHRSFKEYEIG